MYKVLFLCWIEKKKSMRVWNDEVWKEMMTQLSFINELFIKQVLKFYINI